MVEEGLCFRLEAAADWEGRVARGGAVAWLVRMCCSMLGIRFMPSPAVSTEPVRAGPAGLRGDEVDVPDDEDGVGRRKCETMVDAEDFFFKNGEGSESGSEWLYLGERCTLTGVAAGGGAADGWRCSNALLGLARELDSASKGSPLLVLLVLPPGVERLPTALVGRRQPICWDVI